MRLSALKIMSNAFQCEKLRFFSKSLRSNGTFYKFFFVGTLGKISYPTWCCDTTQLSNVL
jgi:hypothetical protein